MKKLLWSLLALLLLASVSLWGQAIVPIQTIPQRSAGGGTWGSITGTLSTQTDLQMALDAKQGAITFGTGVLTALGVNVGSAGAPVVFNGALGTPTSGTLTNATGLPIGGLSGLGAGVATWLGTPSSANLAAAVTGETGTGSLVFADAPTLSGTVTFTGQVLATTFAGSVYIRPSAGNSLYLGPDSGAAQVNIRRGMLSFDDNADVVLNRLGAAILRLEGASSAGATLQFIEQTAPSAPAANNVRLYAQDNGAGKTQLMALFPSGAAQQIAIEP